MKIALGSDHAGFALKERVKETLRQGGHEVWDFGTDSDASVDYPPFILAAAQAVACGSCERAIVFGGSGNGEAMVANRLHGVRCTLCWNVESARFARAHNDSNVLSMGERLISAEVALEIVAIWLDTPFDGGRHSRRLAQIERLTGGGGNPSPAGD
ncbi:MAG TPA: ribose 5-phosphate isomerase B [Thermoanaerobaculia bacterium]|nr:ribose 5-phosphate isomerase B [Thermoanaerobaculia bacterium]